MYLAPRSWLLIAGAFVAGAWVLLAPDHRDSDARLRVAAETGPHAVGTTGDRAVEGVAAGSAALTRRAATPSADHDAEVAEVLARLESLGAELPVAERKKLRRALLDRLARVAPERAAAYAVSLSANEERNSALRQVVSIWMQSDPAATATWVEAHGGRSRNPLLDLVVVRWSDRDFDAALDWALHTAGGAAQERALVHLSYRWIESNPGQALSFTAGLPSDSHQLLSTIASAWASRDPYAAASWARMLADPIRQKQALAAVTASWACRDPEAAASFVAALPPSPAQAEALASVISGWARADPGSAAQWVAQFPTDELRTAAMDQLVPAWAGQTPAAAAEWILQQPDGRSRDAAMDLLSASVVDRHPAVAFTFALSIADEPLRIARLESTARRWLAVDPQRALPAVRAANLPPETARRLGMPRQ